jgi:hypothetical protein
MGAIRFEGKGTAGVVHRFMEMPSDSISSFDRAFFTRSGIRFA